MPKSTGKTRRRSPGEGKIYAHRGAITYIDQDETRRKRLVSGRTSEETGAKLDESQRELRLGTLALTRPLTVAEYLSEWIERHRARVRPSTGLVAESYVRVHLVPALGRRPLSRLTTAEVETALASFVRDGRPAQGGDKRPRQPVSAVTARHVGAILRRALSDAQRAGLVGAGGVASAPEQE